MLGNVVKNSLLRGKSVLLQRYIVPQTAHNIRNKWDAVFSKDQSTPQETEADDQPIKYSTSKAATMRIDEYRDPYGDLFPWYQGIVVSTSLAIFLFYFCVLREENDIDMMLYTDLSESLNKAQKELEKENVRVKSK